MARILVKDLYQNLILNNMFVSRHPIDKKRIATVYESRKTDTAEKIAEAMENPALFRGPVARECHDLFYYSTVAEKDESVIKQILKDYAEASVAAFRMFENKGQKISIQFRGQTIETTAPESGYTLAETMWIKTYYAAIAVRDKAARTALEEIDIDKLATASSMKPDTYLVSFAKFLQGLNSSVDHAANLLKASNESLQLPENTYAYEYMLNITGPQIDLFSKLLYKEEKEFNEQLLKALESHKAYHTKKGKKDMDPEGLVSLPLTGITAYAKMSGFTIEHTSDYIPSCFL